MTALSSSEQPRFKSFQEDAADSLFFLSPFRVLLSAEWLFLYFFLSLFFLRRFFQSVGNISVALRSSFASISVRQGRPTRFEMWPILLTMSCGLK